MCGKVDSVEPFIRIWNMDDILPILKKRLPKSANVHNMAKKEYKFRTEMAFYTMHGDLSEAAWIIATYFREDNGVDISISCPDSLEDQECFEEALGSTGVIDWEGGYTFAAIDRRISSIVRDVSVNVKGNRTGMNPNILFYNLPENVNINNNNRTEALKISDVKIVPLDVESGTNFLFNTWPFATPASKLYIKKIVERNESAGVFDQKTQKLVSGVALAGSGYMTMLFTLPAWRRHGYGRLCMSAHIENLAAQGLIPCCTVQANNEISQAFQLSLGLKISHNVDFIFKCKD